MSGLIFLWQNIPSVPPVIVNVDYGVKPMLVSIISEEALLEAVLESNVIIGINTIFPVGEAKNSVNVFTDTDITWSDTDTSWSDSSGVWGGSDVKGAEKPIMGIIDNVKPEFWKVGNK